MAKSKKLTPVKLEEDVETLGSNESVLFLLDISGSMGQKMSIGHSSQSKIDVLKEAMLKMLDQRMEVQEETEDVTGLVTFCDDRTRLIQGCKLITQEFKDNIQKLRAGGGTPMYQAMWQATFHLDNHARGLARIVVLSDGEPNDNINKELMEDILKLEDAIEMRLALSAGGVDDILVELFRHHRQMAAQRSTSVKKMILELAESSSNEIGVTIDTVGIGRPETTGTYDRKFMEKLAEAGQGTFYQVETPNQIIALLQDMESERRQLMKQGILLLGPASEDDLNEAEG